MTHIFFRRVFLVVVCFFSFHLLTNAATALQLLDKAAANISNAKSLTTSYEIVADGHKQQGHMTISKDKFVISSPAISSWYDGKTQWTYSSQSGEVNIVEPTPEELQQVNPFAIISSFKKLYSATLLKSSANEYRIRLVANNHKNDIKSVILTLNSKTLYPQRIELTLGNRRVVVIQINSISAGLALPLSEFRFNPKSLPGVPVVDLR